MSTTTTTTTGSPSSTSSVTILITGASRGLGSAIANVASQSFANNVRLVLVARSENGLIETKKECSSSSKEASAAAATVIQHHSMDLQDLDELDKNLDILLHDMEIEKYDRAIFINNAGSIGHIGPCKTSPSLKEMRSNVDLNVTSALWMATRFARHIQNHHPSSGQSNILVNITSLAAIADFPTFGIYSAGKAARDKYHTLIAKEEEPDDGSSTKKHQRPFKTLNYAPGPLETEMVSEIRAASEIDSNLKKNFVAKQLDPIDSATKLIRLLISNDFESGAHIDYYDLP